MPANNSPCLAFTLALLLTVSLALLFPAPFLQPGDFQPKTLIVPLLQFIMFAMGARVSAGDLRQVIVAPRSVAIGLGLQYLIMPFSAAALVAAFRLPAEVGAGVILAGSVCAGNSSNVMTYFAGGNMALPVAMTTLSTLLSPLTTPTFMRLLAGRSVPVEFGTLALSIVRLVVVPVTAGLACEWLLRKHKERTDRWLSPLYAW